MPLTQCQGEARPPDQYNRSGSCLNGPGRDVREDCGTGSIDGHGVEVGAEEEQQQRVE